MKKCALRHTIYCYECRLLFIPASERDMKKAQELGHVLRNNRIDVDQVLSPGKARPFFREMFSAMGSRVQDDDPRLQSVDQNEFRPVMHELVQKEQCRFLKELQSNTAALARIAEKHCGKTLVIGPCAEDAQPAEAAPLKKAAFFEIIVNSRTGNIQRHWI